MNLKVGTRKDLPVVSTGPWDGAAAKVAIFRYAGFDGDNPDPAKARALFLYYDTDAPENKTAYFFPIGTIRGGEPVISEEGMAAAAGYLPKGDAPQAVKDQARAVLDGYYAKRDKAEESKSLAERIAYPWLLRA